MGERGGLRLSREDGFGMGFEFDWSIVGEGGLGEIEGVVGVVKSDNSSGCSHSILVKARLPPLLGPTKMAKINYSFEKRQKEIAKKKKKEEKLREKQLAKDAPQNEGTKEEGAQGEGGAPAQESGA